MLDKSKKAFGFVKDTRTVDDKLQVRVEFPSKVPGVSGREIWCPLDRVTIITPGGSAEAGAATFSRAPPSLGNVRERSWRTIVFVRHGKSMWNEAKANGFWGQVKALGSGFREQRKEDHSDTKILDAPLSREGMRQAKAVANFLKLQRIEDAFRCVNHVKTDLEEDLDLALHLLSKKTPGSIADGCRKVQRAIEQLHQLGENQRMPTVSISNDEPLDTHTICDIINHDLKNCIVVASNLRRAISTACISLEDRLEANPKEKIYILSCLQELGSNYDTIPSVRRGRQPEPSERERRCSVLGKSSVSNIQSVYDSRLNMDFDEGNQRNVAKETRIHTFLDWCWKCPKEHIIAFGHSHWFREFFRHALHTTKLPPDKNVKKHKLNNCTMVGFRICRERYEQANGEHEVAYKIPKGTLQIIHGELLN